ncbi:MAG: NAD(+) diphosphatase [Paracoccaceae bacterium]
MTYDLNLFFANTQKINKINPSNVKGIFKKSKNFHIFFCQGLILTKKVKNKLKITYFNKKNLLFRYIDKTVYLGKDGEKNIYVHNIYYYKETTTNLNQIEFFNKIIKKEKLFQYLFSDLRTIFTNLTIKDSSIAGIAKSLINWKLENKFCTKCGGKFENSDNYKWENECSFCNKIYFPRIDPVIIVIVVKGNKTLIGRSHHFPEKLYSCLAGFMELGETIESAAIREIKEEVGINIYDIKFITNQPWPFPSSLMFGLIAKTKHKKLNIDKNEIEDAFWISKQNLKKVLNGDNDNCIAARKGTIARYLLEKWVNNKI